MSTLSISKAIREGLHEEMVRDENVVVLGEDMAVMGNVFAITQGFLDEFGPNRVIDTPISESGFTGMAVGMAMRGLRPVVEWMYDDFITVCLDPVMNQAAKMRYMTGGQVKIPIVFRAPIGAGRRNAGQHSQCLEALFTHIPGLKVVCPSTGADAKGLLKSAIRCDDPVVFLEHKLLYAKKEQIPDGEYLIPLGKADVKRPGKDLTILTWSRQVYFSLEAAETLAAQGITLEIVPYTDYLTPNVAVEEGEDDANFFQHITYMETYNAENNTHLVNAGSIHYEPMGIYAGKTTSLEEIPDGAVIAVPNDATNEGRALLLLQDLGLIELKEDAGLEATPNDITSNPKNLEFKELEAAMLPQTIEEVDLSIINSNYALQAGLNPTTDALASEDPESDAAQAYTNIIAVKEGNENNEAIKALVAALQSDEVREFIESNYNGSVLPMF